MEMSVKKNNAVARELRSDHLHRAHVRIGTGLPLQPLDQMVAHHLLSAEAVCTLLVACNQDLLTDNLLTSLDFLTSCRSDEGEDELGAPIPPRGSSLPFFGMRQQTTSRGGIC